jgi:hypothetical protein
VRSSLYVGERQLRMPLEGVIEYSLISRKSGFKINIVIGGGGSRYLVDIESSKSF